MKITENIFGTKATIEIIGDVAVDDINEVLDYFHFLEKLTNPGKRDSDIAKINTRRIKPEDAHPEVRKIQKLCDESKTITNGFFNSTVDNLFDPSGLVKGYVIRNVSLLLGKKGYKNFYIEIGADLQICGMKNGFKWKVGVQNFKSGKMHVLKVGDRGIATSGLSVRKMPLYNPLTKKIVKHFDTVTVVAKDALEADRFSTAAFVMGEKGINFLENVKDVEAIFIRPDGLEVATSGIGNYM